MSKFKRKLRNVVRNIIVSDKISETKIVKKARQKHTNKIEEKRSKFFKLYAQECLETIKDVLDKENLEFWLDFGTLLGAIREKDFIDHDLDIDLGMIYDDNIPKVEKALLDANLNKVREFTLDGKVVEQTYSYKGLCFDIFYYFCDDKYMWSHGFTYKNNRLKKTTYEKKDISKGFIGVKYFVKKRGLEKIIFKEKEYLVPENPRGYLEENYGPDYMIPVKEWDYIEIPTNKEKLSGKEEILMIEYF